MLLRMYLRWAERRGFEVEMKEASRGRGGGAQVGDLHRPRRERLRPVRRRARRPPAGPDLAVRRPVAPPHQLRPGRRRAAGRRRGRGRASTRRTCGSTPTAPRAPAASTSTRPTRRCGSPTCPTGIVVQCQNERSQTQNKATAMRLLRARLLELEERKRAEELAAERGEQKDVAWGSQIRSYVLHPSTRVKDHRTGHEVGDAAARARRRPRRVRPRVPAEGHGGGGSALTMATSAPSQSGSPRASIRSRRSRRPPARPRAELGAPCDLCARVRRRPAPRPRQVDPARRGPRAARAAQPDRLRRRRRGRRAAARSRRARARSSGRRRCRARGSRPITSRSSRPTRASRSTGLPDPDGARRRRARCSPTPTPSRRGAAAVAERGAARDAGARRPRERRGGRARASLFRDGEVLAGGAVACSARRRAGAPVRLAGRGPGRARDDDHRGATAT